MRLTKQITDKIINDNALSLQIALALNVSQQSVRLKAMRDSANLGHEKAVRVLREYGFKKIFEND